MAAKRAQNPRRNGDLAMIHMAAKQLFGETAPGSDGRAPYEDWLERHTGKRSAGQLSKDERIAFVKLLRREGLIPESGRGGIGRTASGIQRPTPSQWAKIGGLARSMGWNGLEDPALKSFVTRTAKVSSTRFLTRDKATDVILGLEKWLGQKGQGDAMS